MRFNLMEEALRQECEVAKSYANFVEYYLYG